MESKRINLGDNLSVIIEDLSNAISTKYKFVFIDRLEKKLGTVYFEFEEFTSIDDEKLKSIEMAVAKCENNESNILEEFKNIFNIDSNKKFDRLLSAVILVFTKMKEKNCTN